MNSRRKFLKLCTAGTCGSLIHRSLTPYNQMMAFAAAPQVDTGKVIIVVNLSGGASYNSAPIYNGAYRDKNPTISFGEENPVANGNTFTGSHFLNSEQGLHPSLSGFKQIYDEGNLALINMVGYPNPNRSHDESTDIWFRGMRNMDGTTSGVSGWGARLTCQMASVYAGMSLGGSNLLINGGCNPPRSYGNIANLGDTYLPDNNANGYFANITRDELKYQLDLAAPPNDDRALVSKNIDSAASSAQTLKSETNITLPVAFPNSGFGRQCEQAAKLIQARSLRVQFIFLETGGYDTHSDERLRLGQNLLDVNASLSALANALKSPSINRWADTTIFTMSEFCRTFENGSNGTDHGHAGPMFVMGGSVLGGIKSAVPNAAEVNAANGYFHKYYVDFREPFAAAVAHIGLDAAAVFPEQFTRTNNFRLFA